MYLTVVTARLQVQGTISSDSQLVGQLITRRCHTTSFVEAYNSHDRQGKNIRLKYFTSHFAGALSLRLFGEDITTAARDGGKKASQTSQLPQNAGDVFPDEGADNEDEDAIIEGDNEAE
ncbi:hypothetical protein DFJ58DRAFT_726290 [Suillus subalutaceus]|uniref:uncharacterized protein n=1 Tax=Suillus subalutaceus TaxID=48586 RepID=UPI001B873E2F|nr:uncharacterized protein DFJ58DRAFT_726290 [Suillus subalutaceus]KAG1859577.1 hypothetical protein DFJ58DRAFT_726290 [Suillus subalutaceus]